MAKSRNWWEKVAADLDRYWEPDPANKGIRTMELKGWRGYYLRWFKRFTMKQLYIWIKTNWSQLNMMPYKVPLRHDNTLLSPELERKVPRIYQLQGSWTIRDTDLRFLRRGPLISEDGTRVIVPDHGRLAAFFIWIERYWRWAAPFVGIPMLLLAILRLFRVI